MQAAGPEGRLRSSTSSSVSTACRRCACEIDDDYPDASRRSRGSSASSPYRARSTASSRSNRATGPELADGATARGAIAPISPSRSIRSSRRWIRPTRRDVRSLLSRLDAATDGRGADIEETLRFSAQALRETAALTADVRGDGDALRALLRDSRRRGRHAGCRSWGARIDRRRAGRAAAHDGGPSVRACRGRERAARRPALSAPGAGAHPQRGRRAAQGRGRRAPGRPAAGSPSPATCGRRCARPSRRWARRARSSATVPATCGESTVCCALPAPCSRT